MLQREHSLRRLHYIYARSVHYMKHTLYEDSFTVTIRTKSAPKKYFDNLRTLLKGKKYRCVPIRNNFD